MEEGADDGSKTKEKEISMMNGIVHEMSLGVDELFLQFYMKCWHSHERMSRQKCVIHVHSYW